MIHVDFNPDALKAQGLGLNEIDQAVQNWNANRSESRKVNSGPRYFQLFRPVKTIHGTTAGDNGFDGARLGVIACRRRIHETARDA